MPASYKSYSSTAESSLPDGAGKIILSRKKPSLFLMGQRG